MSCTMHPACHETGRVQALVPEMIAIRVGLGGWREEERDLV